MTEPVSNGSTQRITATPLWTPVVQDHRSVIRGEWVLVDGDLAEIVAWNDIPVFYVRMKNKKELKEIEPWRIKKIEKCPES